jgi:hypothetical protein
MYEEELFDVDDRVEPPDLSLAESISNNVVDIDINWDITNCAALHSNDSMLGGGGIMNPFDLPKRISPLPIPERMPSLHPYSSNIIERLALEKLADDEDAAAAAAGTL